MEARNLNNKNNVKFLKREREFSLVDTNSENENFELENGFVAGQCTALLGLSRCFF